MFITKGTFEDIPAPLIIIEPTAANTSSRFHEEFADLEAMGFVASKLYTDVGCGIVETMIQSNL